MKILKFSEYSISELIVNDFINSFNILINESERNDNESIRRKIFSDLRLNGNLSLTFGVGINALYPVVDSLIRNMKISSIDITSERVILLTICAFTIIYLEEKKYKDTKEEDIIRGDIKSMLVELKMLGIGNGIVKKMVRLLKSFTNIYNAIYRHIGKAVDSFIDMFAYVSILIPIINAISYIIGKYTLNTDTFILNIKGLIIGIGTIVSKHGIKYLINKIKGINIKNITPLDTLGDEMINEQ